jgi:hypothetical protein
MEPYVSNADHGFIRTWPPGLLWSIALAIAATCAGAGYAYDALGLPTGAVKSGFSRI